MRAWKLSKLGLVVALAAIVVVGVAWPAHAGQVAKKQEILMGPYFETLKPGDSIEESIKRGSSLGEGVTAVDATGNRMPIPIPDLRGVALHYPRIGGSGFIATLGMLNDM